jgi:hypothetical protein
MNIMNITLALAFLLLASSRLPAQFLHGYGTVAGLSLHNRGLLAMTVGSKERLDFNGDGIPERSFVARDPAQGDVLRIVDGSDASRSWTVRLEGDPDRPIIIGRHMLVGFFDFDGIVSNENPKELVFAKRIPSPGFMSYTLEDVLISSYSSTQTYSPWQPLGIIAILIGIVDLNRDGTDEVILANPAANQTEIWGAP